jgi:hypothetical protein
MFCKKCGVELERQKRGGHPKEFCSKTGPGNCKDLFHSQKRQEARLRKKQARSLAHQTIELPLGRQSEILAQAAMGLKLGEGTFVMAQRMANGVPITGRRAA